MDLVVAITAVRNLMLKLLSNGSYGILIIHVVTWNFYEISKRELIRTGMEFLHLLRRFASHCFPGMVA